MSNNSFFSKKNILIMLFVVTIVILAFLIIKLSKANDNYYEVNFYTSGGTSVESIKVQKDSKAVQPEDPEKDGYIFVEWQLNGETYDFNTPVTSNITLKAKWKKVKENTYVVKFNTAEGSKISSLVVEKGETITKPENPTKEGYTFVEWQLNGETYDFNTPVTSNVELVAVWKSIESTTTTNKNQIVTYVVNFDSNGGTKVNSQTIQKGNKAIKPTNPTKSGYKVSGWLLNGKTYDFNTPVTSNITLKANWVQKTYTVSLEVIDAYSPDRNLVVKEEGSIISVSQVKYANGTKLCDGNNLTINMYDLDGISTLIIVLTDGTQVNASVK